jgi:hypothetical protein
VIEKEAVKPETIEASREGPKQFWNYHSPAWAGKFLDLCGHSPYVAKGAGRAVEPLFRPRVRHISEVDQRLVEKLQQRTGRLSISCAADVVFGPFRRPPAPVVFTSISISA